MKRITVLLFVCLFAASSVFAAVDFSGSLSAGYTFNYDNGGSGEWETAIYGEDGDDTNTTQIDLNISDEDGLWNIGIEGTPNLNYDGGISGDIMLDLAKIITGGETDWSAQFALNVNDNMVGLRAYHRASGNNYDRVRTASNGLWTSVQLGYGDLVTVQAAGSPETVETSAGSGSEISANGGDVLLSALISPVKGLKLSAAWALNGNRNGDSEMKVTLRGDEDTKYAAGGNGVAAVAFDLNLAEMFDWDFSLGFSATERYAFATETNTSSSVEYNALDYYNTFAASVYGGAGVVSFAAEYAMHAFAAPNTDMTVINFLYGKIGLNVVPDMGLKFYAGANDLEEAGDTYFAGGTVDYTYKGISYALNVDYSCPDGRYSESVVNTRTGFSVTPSISVAF